MKILQVNYYDNWGGAARIAWLLHQGYKLRDYQTWMMVGEKYSSDSTVFQIPLSPPHFFVGKAFFYLAEWLAKQGWSLRNKNLTGLFRRLANPRRYWNRYLGYEDFDFPDSRKILDLHPEKPDIVHLHNMHMNYFDLTYLDELSQNYPTVLTLHDMWALTGHCAYSLDCEKWKTRCELCPNLKTYPAMYNDKTTYNWQRKKQVFAKSYLHVVTPSKWLMKKVDQSILAPAVLTKKVIPNGVDLKVFSPQSKELARKQLDLPLDKEILLFVSASGIDKYSYKGYGVVEAAVEIIANNNDRQNILVIALGKEKVAEKIGRIEVRYIPYQTSLEKVADYYRAADIYLHTARADNFPNVVLEAQACGTPVLATSVGGISEQIIDGQTGFLTMPEDPNDMAEKIVRLLKDESLRKSMGTAAGDHVREHFGVDRMIASYLNFYQEILGKEKLL